MVFCPFILKHNTDSCPACFLAGTEYLSCSSGSQIYEGPSGRLIFYFHYTELSFFVIRSFISQNIHVRGMHFYHNLSRKHFSHTSIFRVLSLPDCSPLRKVLMQGAPNILWPSRQVLKAQYDQCDWNISFYCSSGRHLTWLNK